MTPGPEGERPRAPVSARPPTPWYRRPAVVVLAALAVALVLSVIEANRAEHDAAPTQSTHPGVPWNDIGGTPEDPALTDIVAVVMRETQTDPAAWSHVTRVNLSRRPVRIMLVVDTTSRAMVERICEQARRYMSSSNAYSPRLRDGGLEILGPRGLHYSGDGGDGCEGIRAPQ